MRRTRWLGHVLWASGLVVVVVVIAIGASRVAADAPSEPDSQAAPSTQSSGAPPSVADPSVEPEPVTLLPLYFVDVRSGRTTPLPRSIRSIRGATQFAASPNGGRLAFAAGDSIYVAQIDGEHIRKVAKDTYPSAPSWSPDGKRLVYSTDAEDAGVFVVNVQTRQVSRVAPPGGQVWHPNFSPDGRTILFTMDSGGGLALFTVPARGGKADLLLRLPSEHTYAAFGSYGPDGKIAYRRTQYDGVDPTHMTQAQVFVLDDTGLQRSLLKAGGGWMSQIDPQALWPMWSPDGSKIAFERLYSNGVFVVDVRTGDVTSLGEGSRITWVDDDTLIMEQYPPI